MSLTSFVRTPEIKRRILEEYPLPPFNKSGPMVAPPRTRNFAEVGTAFDYVFRFTMQAQYPTIAKTSTWVAELGLRLLEADFLPVSEVTVEGAHNTIADAKVRLAEFIKTKNMTDDLLADSMLLARLDQVFRSGRVPDLEAPVAPGDIADLRRLYNTIPLDRLSGLTRVILNPTFGRASALTGGGDPDLVLDTDLIDIKTTKFLRLDPDAWVQLIGYAVLADFAVILGEDFPRLSAVGIYFARHGGTWGVPAETIYGTSGYPAFRRWFSETAAQMFPKSVQRVGGDVTKGLPPERVEKE